MGYRIKKAIPLCFFLLVNIIILAHAVIPHHHHDGIPVTVHHEHDDNMPDHQKTDNLHEFLLLTKAKNAKQTYQLFDFGFDLMPCLLTLFSDCSIYWMRDEAGLLFRYPPFIQLHHTESIARSIGLRAPPFQLKIRN